MFFVLRFTELQAGSYYTILCRQKANSGTQYSLYVDNAGSLKLLYGNITLNGGNVQTNTMYVIGITFKRGTNAARFTINNYSFTTGSNTASPDPVSRVTILIGSTSVFSTGYPADNDPSNAFKGDIFRIELTYNQMSDLLFSKHMNSLISKYEFS